MTALRIVGLLGVLNATAASAQAPPFLVINNTDATLTCSSRVQNGIWQKWFELPPGANWTGPDEGAAVEFQCRPPVEQVAYSLKQKVRYSLLPSTAGIRLVEVTQGR